MLKKIFSSLYDKATALFQFSGNNYDIAQQPVSYILLDMQGTALGNVPLVNQLSALKASYNIKIIACSTDHPDDTQKDLEEMKGFHQFDDIYNGDSGVYLTHPPRMSKFSKNDPDFYSSITLNDQPILPKDMFLIDDMLKNCNAILHVGGSRYHYFMDDRSPSAIVKKNARALEATEKWLKKRRKISPA